MIGLIKYIEVIVLLTESRRKEILKVLKNSKNPLTGTDLAKNFEVSRQVVVQDIAVLRAQGENILATSNGYMIPQFGGNKNIITLVCKHQAYESMEEELRIMVDSGAKILDVVVEHPIYGEIRSSLMIQSRLELSEFMEKVRKNQAEPLASLTGGEHIHTLEIPNEKAHKKIIKELKERGYIISEE